MKKQKKYKYIIKYHNIYIILLSAYIIIDLYIKLFIKLYNNIDVLIYLLLFIIYFILLLRYDQKNQK